MPISTVNTQIILPQEIKKDGPTPTPALKMNKKFPFTAGLLIFSGLLFLGFAVYPFVKNTKKGNLRNDKEDL